MTNTPIVIVTATTETVRERPRVRVNEAYTNALAAFGVVPMVLPPIDPDVAVAALDSVAGLVLTGGEDVDPRYYGEAPHTATAKPHAARDACELALARAAAMQRIPTFAICRGAQILNVALGGTLVQHVPEQYGTAIDHELGGGAQRQQRVHEIAIEADTRLAKIVGETAIRVNSSHHQSVGLPAPTLHVTAKSPDGVIEALESNDREWWMVAVQWHPEELTATAESWDRRLFAAFADAARAGARSTPRGGASAGQLANRQRASSRT